jgi:transcriptional regulator with XRE-family HTH domain
MDRFARWVDSVGSQDGAAALLGISQTHVSQMARGERRPGVDTALAIEQATKQVTEKWSEGSITVAEWGQSKARVRKRRARKSRSSRAVARAS